MYVYIYIFFFEKRVLRRIFGPKRDEVTGKWRRLHDEELYALCSSPNIIMVIKSRIMRWAGHVAHAEERRGANRVLVVKSVGRRPFGMPMYGWEDNIKMSGWIEIGETWERLRVLVNAVINMRVP
jgi:hypothetical protein